MVDVAADNLDGTMDRFADGLRRVLAVPKGIMTTKLQHKKRKRPMH